MTISKSRLMALNVVSFAQDIDPSLEADMLDCLLYAQVSGELKAGYLKGWAWWVRHYCQTLGEFFGDSNGNVSSTTVTLSDIGQIKDLQLQTSGAASAPSIQRVLSESLERITTSDHARLLFSEFYSSGTSARFQVLPCTPGENGTATILVCGFQLTKIPRGPGPSHWNTVGGAIFLFADGQSFCFSRERYAPHRQRVQDYLSEQGRLALLDL